MTPMIMGRPTSKGVVVLLLLLAGVADTPPAEAAGRVARKAWETPRSGHEAGAKVVALTFDDGPHPTYTKQVLEVLRRYDARATFFPVGKEAKRYPKYVRRAANRGHGIGGHTWSHADLRGLSDSQFSYQVDKTIKLLATLPDPDRAIRCVRPPFGAYDSQVVSRLGSRGITTMLWSVDPQDWRRPGTRTIVNRVLGNLHDGAVVVLHDGGGDRSQTVAALPAIIRGIRARGYKIVPICRR